MLVKRPGFIFRSVCLWFMVIEWQWDRTVWVLQLSVASISLPMYRCHFLNWHLTPNNLRNWQRHLMTQFNKKKLIGLFLMPAATVSVNLFSLPISGPEQPHFWGGGNHRAKWVTVEFRWEGGTIWTVVNRAELQIGQEAMGLDIVMLVGVFFV